MAGALRESTFDTFDFDRSVAPLVDSLDKIDRAVEVTNARLQEATARMELAKARLDQDDDIVCKAEFEEACLVLHRATDIAAQAQAIKDKTMDLMNSDTLMT